MRWWDIDAVLAVEGPSFGADAWSREQLLSELAERGTRRLLVLEADGVLVGYLGIAVLGAQAEIQTLAVAPEHRGQGLGSLLLRRACETARQAGARRLGLEVREDDEVAVGLYTGAGFTRSGRRPGYYAPTRPGGPRTAALLMDRDLT